MIRAIILLTLISPVVAADYRAMPRPPAESVLVTAARQFDGVQFQNGLRDPYLVEEAQGYADWMATHGRQGGHYDWDRRYAKIKSVIRRSPVEVTAESWDRQASAPMAEIGRTMFESWKYSAGHWRIVSTPHARYGDAISKSRRGIYYACVIVAN
jgi:hypothetical protein